MRKKWTEEEVEFLNNNYGIIPIDEICEKLNRSKNSIERKATRDNIISPRKWREEEIEYLKKNYRTQTYKQLSEHLNRTKTAIDIKINRLGLVKSQYTYNHSFFKEIRTEEQAYWCGFIMADGCVFHNEKTNSCELCIKLQAADGDHLKKFNKSLCGNIPITYYTDTTILPGRTDPITSRQAQIRIYSEEIFHDISKYGVIPNKSLIKVFPTNIPDSLISHFIRGYFDGNGTIGLSGGKSRAYNKQYIFCSFCTGSKKFVEGLKNKLEQFNILSSPIYKNQNSNSYILKINGMSNVDNFIHFIYSNSTVYLDRKFHKKNKLYELTNMEQRLLRQAERPVYSRNESSEKESGKAEMLTRVEGYV